MEYTTLGRTDLRVSVMGMGCGGPSRAGLSTHGDEAESVRVIRAALDAGVNIIDTAEGYGTEEVVGRALSEVRREGVVIATKKSMWGDDGPPSADDVVAGLEASLTRLGTDYVDVYFLHGVSPEGYADARDQLVPVLDKLRDQGKIRFTGVTEVFSKDPDHAMVRQAVADDWCDVVMVGFNILNQCARDTIFPTTMAKGIATLIMFPVRRAFSRPDALREAIADLAQRGRIKTDLLGDDDDPLGFLLHEGGATTIPDAAYRFCRHEPGCDVILSGTGSIDHMQENIASLIAPDLPAADRERLEAIFAGVDDVSGN